MTASSTDGRRTGGVPVGQTDPEEAVTTDALDKLGPLVEPDKLPQVELIVEQAIQQVSHHSGPLPQATELARYKDIDGSFAERIVAMAEKEQTFRHSLPGDLLKHNYLLKSRGQHYALAIATMVLVFAAYLAYLGDTKMAGSVAIATLVGLVGVFVGGRAIDALTNGRERADADD